MRIQRDRGWAWIVLVCVICSQIILGGVCFSSGIFYMIFMDVFPSDPIGVSWLCSLPITMWFISAPVGSYVTNRYGYRTCAFIGGIIAATGLTLTYFVTNLSFLFFSHGILTGFTQTNFGTVLMVNSVSKIVGKAVFSFIGHHPKINCAILYTVSLAVSGVAMGLTPLFLTKIGMLLLTVFIGFFVCVLGALLPAVIYGIVGFDRFTDGMGLSLPFKATGNLIGGPLAGILLASTGSYEISFYIAGVSMVFSQVLMVYPIVHQKQRQKAHRNKDMYTVYEISVENCTEADTCIKPLNSSYEIKQEILSLETNDNENLNKVGEHNTLLNP
ncbi:monocarboxylate transporter 13-like isoform X3 [Mercenaria mercenaria]|uniref:monocarboxylate transporter 13-like isoform X3 n=1 Tax=Mercenaria mercenaria TaxID=6596 RepID=UPI001E1DC92B|nr:monocarboxylate transporter 13-like isoform X3 [Mercenaria mercenaria]